MVPLGAKDIKDLHKAVTEDGPNSRWAQTLLQDIAYTPCVPKDWMDLPKAVLTRTQYIKWCAYYKEECRSQVEANREAQPPIPIKYGMLAGMADGFSTGIQQAAVASPYRLGLFMVSQISWTFCFMTCFDLMFSLTDESISCIWTSTQQFSRKKEDPQLVPINRDTLTVLSHDSTGIVPGLSGLWYLATQAVSVPIALWPIDKNTMDSVAITEWSYRAMKIVNPKFLNIIKWINRDKIIP
ncbi:hypothetical protein STEG23_032624, partial [Scotinomys teguina]